MPKEKKPTKTYGRPAGKSDVFARLDSDVVEKLDKIVESMTPSVSRSAVIAMLIENFVNEKWPESQAE